MTRRPAHWILTALIAAQLVGCAADASMPTEGLEEQIELMDDGSEIGEAVWIDERDPVVAVTLGDSICSGVVIGTYTLVTPVGCTQGPIEDMAVWHGNDLGTARSFRVDSVIDIDETLSVVITERPVSALDAWIADDPMDEEEALVVGYGGSGEVGQRTMHTYAVDGDALHAEDAVICDGDVGGALFNSELELVGLVTQTPPDDACQLGAEGARWTSVVELRELLTRVSDIEPLCLQSLEGC